RTEIRLRYKAGNEENEIQLVKAFVGRRIDDRGVARPIAEGCRSLPVSSINEIAECLPVRAMFSRPCTPRRRNLQPTIRLFQIDARRHFRKCIEEISGCKRLSNTRPERAHQHIANIGAYLVLPIRPCSDQSFLNDD